MSTWWIESVSSDEFGIVNRRYSSLRGRPSSKTTIDATMFVPLRCDTSKHSMRSGASAMPSASWMSSSARERVVKSALRRVL